MTVGALVGTNILNLIQNRPLRNYQFTGLGDAASVGNRKAVGHLKGIPLLGFPAWIVWRIFMFFYVPTWDRRLRVLSDWLLWPFIGRDIVSIQKKEGLGITQRFFEPGQLIIVEGEIGKDLYVIQSGEVEIIKEGSGENNVLTELGPGDHFGEQAIYSGTARTASVRAKTRVELLAISRSAALTLGNTLENFGSEMRTLPGKK
jgi:NADH dehydrogenase